MLFGDDPAGITPLERAFRTLAAGFHLPGILNAAKRGGVFSMDGQVDEDETPQADKQLSTDASRQGTPQFPESILGQRQTPFKYRRFDSAHTGDEPRALRLTAVADDGRDLAAPASLSLGAGAALEQDVRTLFDFASGPAVSPALEQPPQLTVGSIRVEADGPGVAGDVLFGDPVDFAFAASMPLQSAPLRRAVFSHVANTLDFFTGLALFNPNRRVAEITISVFDAGGAATGQETIQLGPGARLSRLLTQLVPATAGQSRGYITLQSTQPVIALQVFGETGLKLLSAVPPTVVR